MKLSGVCVIAAVLLVVGSPTRAVQPTPILITNPKAVTATSIDGPTELEVGERCILKVLDPGDATLRWELISDDRDDTFVVFCEGEQLAFWSGSSSGRHVFMLIAATPQADGELTIETYRHTVEVRGGSDPGTPDDPGGDTLPGGRFGLARLCRDIAPEGSAAQATALAAAYRSVASQDHDDVRAMLTAQTKLNKKILGDDGKKWQPFGQSLGAALGELVAAGKLEPTVEAHAVAWLEIAQGLEAVQ